MKILIATFAFLLLISGCKEERFEKGAIIKMTGPYNSILPCEGCRGISYELSLSEDMKFKEKIIYLNDNINPINNSGTWQLDDDEGMIRLFKKTNAMTQFLITKEGLIMLDSTGKRYTGEDADKYILKRGPMEIPEYLLVDTSAVNDPNSVSGLWILTEINGKKPDRNNFDNQIPDLNISQSDNKFKSNTGCNTTKGGVQIRGDLMSFSKFISTRMACQKPGENEYVAALKEINSYSIEDGILSLKAAEKTLLKFQK